MQRLIRNLLTDKAIFSALAFSILILVLSLIPQQSKLLAEVKNSDKIIHIFFYTLLCLSWLFYFKPYKKLKSKFIVGFGVFVYGIIIEILQSTITTYRTGSIYDVFANGIGILIALIFFEQVYRLVLPNKNK